MDSISLKAYAKINLGLDVMRRLENGYHEVKMVMQNVDIWDKLTLTALDETPTALDETSVSPDNTTVSGGILVSVDDISLPTDENNLVYKAAKLMKDQFGITQGVHIQLEKNIPIAAGMAGGSTDAAAVMKGMRTLFRPEITDTELMKIAVKIGADVPYCILGGTALSEGIGEILTPLHPMPHCYILVVKPDISVSTKYVYTNLDLQNITAHPDIDGMVRSIQEGSLAGILSRMENVLETVTIPAHPIIDKIKGTMLDLGACASLMSGSGPTVFGIYTNEETAQKAYEQFVASGVAKQVFLTTPVS